MSDLSLDECPSHGIPFVRHRARDAVVDVPSRDRFLAMRADEPRRRRMIAVPVSELDGRAVRPIDPPLAPVFEGNNDREEVDALLGQEVFIAYGSLLVGPPCHHPGMFEFLDPDTQEVR